MTRGWIRRILAVAPDRFTERFRDEFLASYEARLRDVPSGWRRLVFQIRELAGTVWLVLRLHLASLRGSRARPDRSVRSAEAFGSVWQDVRFAVRTLRRRPGFAAAAIVVLAVGIGANTAIFSAANAYLFRPLPFADSDRLVTIVETNPEFGWVDEVAAPANLLDWRERVDSFADVSGYSEATDDMTAFLDGEPIIVTGTEVMGNFFSTLGVPAAMGRTFTMEETWLGSDNVVVISHDLWVRHYGADPNVIGERFEFATHNPEVVGVMPAGFRFPDADVEIWYPIGWDPAQVQEEWFRRAHFIRAFGRLAPDVSVAQADAELQVVVGELQREYPGTNAVMGAGIVPLRDFLLRDVRTPLLVLLGAVWLLLLLACTNVANLMLVRASERTREVALRRALGAGRRRLIRQMLTESLILAGIGGALGLALGWAAVRIASGSIPMGIGGATTLSLDYRVVLFTTAAAGLSAVLFGLPPALRVAARGRGEKLTGGSRGTTGATEGRRTVGFLVSAEVALALLLVVGAGLMTRTFWELGQVDPGFRTEGVLAVQFAVQSAGYPERDQVLSFYDRFAAALEARPGIERVGQVERLPLDGPNWTSQFVAEGWDAERVGFEILHRPADVGYFEALDIPLIRGRTFGPADGPDAPSVVLVNEAFADEHFPGEDPVGQRIAFSRSPGPETQWHEIIGVVGNQHQESLAQPVRPEVFEHSRQDWGRLPWTVIRVSGDPLDHVPAVRSVLAELDPRIPLAAIRTMDSVRGASMAQESVVLGLLGAFGLVALLLAALGVYGVTSVAVRRRVPEIGIRMALGARPNDVVGLTLRRAMVVVGIGLGGGLVVSLLTTEALRSLLYGVEPTDPATLAGVAALLGGVAFLASWLPARRATAVDPAISLRAE